MLRLALSAALLLGQNPVSRFYASSAFSIPAEAVAVVVDSTTTLVTGGALDWIGRPTIKPRTTAGEYIMVYYRATGHATNDGALYVRYTDDYGVTWTAENTLLGGGAAAGWPRNTTSSASRDAFEPWLYRCPNGDLLLHSWDFDFGGGGSMNGTHQWRSTDEGDTWTDEGGPIDWIGHSSTLDLGTFSTDEDLIIGSAIYAGARAYNDPDEVPAATVLVTSDDNGTSWNRKSVIVHASDLGGLGTQEFGLTWNGGSNLLAVIRDTAAITHTYKSTSSDLGATWTAISDITADVGVLGRPRIYHRAQLKGQADWQLDPILLMTGFVHVTPGTSTNRRNAVWVSRNFGSSWDGPFYIDTGSGVGGDGGYSDMLYDLTNDQYVVVSYKGPDLNSSDLKVYRLSIDGV